MKKTWIRCLSLMTVLAIITTCFTPAVQAQTAEKKKISELAETLEFIYEKAAVKDSNGKIVDIDVEMIEEKYGESPSLDGLKSELEQKNNLKRNINLEINQTNALNSVSPAVIMPPDMECVRSELSDWVEGLPFAALTAVYSHLMDGEYLSAAKKLIKSGAKGSAAGLAAKLTVAWFKCH